MSKITVIVTGETGSGKSAIAGEIEIALKAIGVPVAWQDADRENWTHGNEYWIDLYKPEVTIVEQNIPVGIPAAVGPSPHPGASSHPAKGRGNE